MTIFQRWKQTAIHNKALVLASAVMAFGTVFYAVAAVFQICIMKQASKDSAAQVERIVSATNKAITDAIKAGNEATVKALQDNRESLSSALAQNDKSLTVGSAQGKRALEATIDASRLDQRAWVSIAGATTVNAHFDPHGRLQFDSVSIGVRNSGKTPAIEVEQKCCLLVGRYHNDRRYMNYEIGIDLCSHREHPTISSCFTMEDNTGAIGTIISGSVAPQFTGEETIVNAAGIAMGWDSVPMPTVGNPTSNYILGTITYRDIFPGTEIHHTDICLVRNGRVPAFGMCPNSHVD